MESAWSGNKGQRQTPAGGLLETEAPTFHNPGGLRGQGDMPRKHRLLLGSTPQHSMMPMLGPGRK